MFFKFVLQCQNHKAQLYIKHADVIFSLAIIAKFYRQHWTSIRLQV